MTVESDQSNEVLRDALTEIANIAGGTSSTALENLFADQIKVMGQKLVLDYTLADYMNLDDVKKIMLEKKQLVIVNFPISTRDVKGIMTLTLSFDNALMFVSLFQKNKEFYHTLDESDQEIIKKISQVILDSYLNAFSTFLDIPVIYSELKLSFIKADRLIDFIQQKVSRMTKNTIIFQIRFSMPTTEIAGEFEFLCALRDFKPIKEGIDKKMGGETTDAGVNERDFLPLANGKIVRNIDELIAAIKVMPDAEFLTYISGENNLFAEWISRAYKSEEYGRKVMFKRTKAETLDALEKEKIMIADSLREKEKAKKVTELIARLKEECSGLKQNISDLRREGKDVGYADVNVDRILSKIKVAEATEDLEDIQKVQLLIDGVKKELGAL